MALTDLSYLTCERCKFSCKFACFACQYFANLHCNTLHALQFALQLHTLQILRSRNAQFACAATPARFANRLTIVCNLLANLACACACLLFLPVLCKFALQLHTLQIFRSRNRNLHALQHLQDLQIGLQLQLCANINLLHCI